MKRQNKMLHEVNEKIEFIPKGTAQRIINNIIWGNSPFNPNKENDPVENNKDEQKYGK